MRVFFKLLVIFVPKTTENRIKYPTKVLWTQGNFSYLHCLAVLNANIKYKICSRLLLYLHFNKNPAYLKDAFSCSHFHKGSPQLVAHTYSFYFFATPRGFVSPPKIKPGIFYLLDGCVNHYTMQPLKNDHLYKVKTEHIPVSLLLQFKFSIVHTCPGDWIPIFVGLVSV